MAEPLHHCPWGGYLVGGSGSRVPDDPSEYAPHRVILGQSIGCNRLRCGVCGQWVRNRAGLEGEGPATDLAGEDWAAVPWVTTNRRARLYACGHSVATVYRTHALEPDDLAAEAPRPVWRCQGHPLPSLPLVVDGVRIDDDTDLSALVEKVFAGWMPDESPVTDLYEQWVARLYERLAGLPHADAVALAVADCLSHPDPTFVGAALVFYGRYPRAPGFEWVVTLTEDPRRTRASWPARTGSSTHDYPLLPVLLRRVETARDPMDDKDLRALDAARKLVLDPRTPLGDQDVLRLCDTDRQWLADHATEIVRAHPDRFETLVYELAVRDSALGTIAGIAVIRSGAVDPGRLSAFVHGVSRLSWGFVLRQALESR